MSEVIKKIREKLKEDKIFYSIEHDTVVLEIGTFNGGMFLEKFDHLPDYTMMQTWVMREDNDDDEFDLHHHDNFSLDDIVDIIDELVDSVKSHNSGISKIKKKLDEIIDLANTYQIDSAILNDIVTNSIEDYE